MRKAGALAREALAVSAPAAGRGFWVWGSLFLGAITAPIRDLYIYIERERERVQSWGLGLEV